MFKNRNVYAAVISSLILAACGGSSSDSDDDTQLGEVDDERAELSQAAVELSKQVVGYEASGGSPLGVGAKASDLEELAKLSEQVFEATMSETNTTQGQCGGTFTVTTVTETPDGDEFFPFEVDAEGEFDDYCIGDRASYFVEFDGDFDYYWYISQERSVFEYDYDYSYQVTAPNFTRTGTTVASESCVRENQTTTCTVGSSYQTSGGDNYEITDVNLSGDDTNGYDFSATVVDDDMNSYSVTADDVTVCDSGTLGSGTIDLEINNDLVIEIDIISCTEYQVTYLGQTETFQQ